MEINTQEETSLKTPGFVLLYDYYSEVLKNKGSKFNVNDLFAERKARAFIHECFSEECRNAKIKRCIDDITPFRAIHTVSAFLLGLIIRDKLKIDTRNWRRLPGERSPEGSFKLFWSWICLFHDIGYVYEDNSAEFESFSNIEDFIRYLNLDYDLLEESKNKELITNYFKKRIDERKVDHGIVGALLLYDALMDLAKNSKIYSSIKEYKSFFVKICDTIALHNMWRASPNNIDNYELYGLWELIPSGDQHHIIFYKDNPLLFLLAVVDTIDPIKEFCRDRRYRIAVTAISVLNNTDVHFVNRTGVKKLNLSYNGPGFHEYAQKHADPENGMMSWLGVFVSDYINTQWKETLSVSINLVCSVSGDSLNVENHIHYS